MHVCMLHLRLPLLIWAFSTRPNSLFSAYLWLESFKGFLILLKPPQTIAFACLVQIVVMQSVNYLLQYFFSKPKGFVNLSTAHILALLPEQGW